MSFCSTLQDPAGIFELVEVVGNGTYGQVYKVGVSLHLWVYFVCAEAETGAQTHTPRFFLLILRCLRLFMIYLPLLHQETLCS